MARNSVPNRTGRSPFSIIFPDFRAATAQNFSPGYPMEKAIDNLTNVSVNTEASRGRIRDANFAKESAALTKAQILQQSALAMIAQAGRIQQNVLTLLQN